jgi:hypothetical protein
MTSKSLPTCNLDRAGVWDVLTASWLNPLLSLGWKRPLDTAALEQWGLPAAEEAASLNKQFSGAWTTYPATYGKGPWYRLRTLRSLFAVIRRRLFIGTVLPLCDFCTIFFCGPITLIAFFLVDFSQISKQEGFAQSFFVAQFYRLR